MAYPTAPYLTLPGHVSAASSYYAVASGGAVSVYQGTKWIVQITGLTTGVDISEAIVSIKAAMGDTDNQAKARISSLAGLERIAGLAVADVATVVAGDGALVANTGLGTALITVMTDASELIGAGIYSYDIRYIDSAGEELMWSTVGDWNVLDTVTDAV